MKQFHPDVAEKRDPIRIISWPWIAVYALAAALCGALYYYTTRKP